MNYYSAIGQVVLFGGGRADDRDLNDTWLFDPVTNIWINKKPTISPAERLDVASCYDTIAERVILFSGWDQRTLPPDTWTFNISTSGVPACSIPK